METTISECPCGCDCGLDENHEAHSNSTLSLIKEDCESDLKRKVGGLENPQMIPAAGI